MRNVRSNQHPAPLAPTPLASVVKRAEQMGGGGEGERNQQERKRGIKKETTTTKNHHRKRKKGAYTREKSNRSESTDRYVSIPQEGTQNWHPAKQSLYPNEIIASKSKSHQIPPLYLYRNFKSVLVSPSNTYHESQHIYR